MVAVTPDNVRNRVHLTTVDIPDNIVTEFIVDAEVEIEQQTGLTLDYTSCTQAEATAIKALAAIYCLCYVTGGSHAGMSFSLGDLRVDALGNVPPLSILKEQVTRLIQNLGDPAFKVSQA